MIGIYRFYNRVDTEVEHYTRQATQWVSSINREALGSFVTVNEEFIAFIALKQWNDFTQQNPAQDSANERYYEAVMEGLKQNLHNAAQTYYGAVHPIDELVFWKRVAEGKVSTVQNYFGSHQKYLSGIAKMRRMETMYIYPHLTTYFEADIWDVAFLEKALSSGVDPSLVLGLFVNA